jgi:hypothetical protein
MDMDGLLLWFHIEHISFFIVLIYDCLFVRIYSWSKCVLSYLFPAIKLGWLFSTRRFFRGVETTKKDVA